MDNQDYVGMTVAEIRQLPDAPSALVDASLGLSDECRVISVDEDSAGRIMLVTWRTPQNEHS